MSYSFSRTWGFLRLGIFVVSYTCKSPAFSERYGYKKPIIRIGKYRVFFYRSVR